MTRQQKTHLLLKLRTELAFLYSDRCQGGPVTESQMEAMRRAIAELQAEATED